MPTIPVRDILKNVRRNYQEADKIVEKKALKLKATCTKGCSACCYQLVTISLIEALVLADFLIRNRTAEELGKIKGTLKENSEQYGSVRDRRKYFESKKPCPFLKLKAPYSGECTVYSSRPLACRLQYVVSDPKFCSPDSPDTRVHLVDVTELHLSALRHICGGSEELASHGPLEPMVLHAIELAETGGRPSPLELAHWRRWTGVMLAQARQALDDNNIEETYVEETEK